MQLEELTEKLRQGQTDQTMFGEQLSIFQNKDMAQYRNVNAPSSSSSQNQLRKCELTIENLNQKLSKLKVELQKLKEENLSLKTSNEN